MGGAFLDFGIWNLDFWRGYVWRDRIGAEREIFGLLKLLLELEWI